MPRFFKENFYDAPFIVGDDASHIVKSLRMKPGETLTVCDTKGTDFLCEIVSADVQRVDLKILSNQNNISEPTVAITLYLCLTKGDKFDTVIKHSVELGISRLVPVISSRCVSRPDPHSIQKKLVRWQKIANEAAGQSGRGILPVVENCISFTDAVGEFSNYEKVFFCYELGGEPIPLLPDLTSTAIVIGPEGGFDASEANQAIKGGAIPTSLGPRILRAETAPVAALAALLLQTGNMG